MVEYIYMVETKQISSHGKRLLSWEFPETENQEKSRGWYFLVTLFFFGLALFALFSKNYLFLIFLILFFAILVIEWRRPIETKTIEIFEEGIEVANKFYDWDDLETFWIIYQPPKIKKLYLNPRGTLNLEFSVPLEEQNPVKIRDLLRSYVKEDLDRKSEPLYDSIRRGLKI